MIGLESRDEWEGQICGPDRLGVLFFFQAGDGIRDADVTGVQTCALPIWTGIRPACCSSLPRLWPTAGYRRRTLARCVRPWMTPRLPWPPWASRPCITWPRSRQARSEERRVGKEGSTRGSRAQSSELEEVW